MAGQRSVFFMRRVKFVRLHFTESGLSKTGTVVLMLIPETNSFS